MTTEPSAAASTEPVIVIGTPQSPIADEADRLLDDVTMALAEFDTETLNAIADYRDSIHPEGWMQTLIRQYVEVWR